MWYNVYKRRDNMKLDKLEKVLNNLYSKETCYPACKNQWNNDNKL